MYVYIYIYVYVVFTHLFLYVCLYTHGQHLRETQRAAHGRQLRARWKMRDAERAKARARAACDYCRGLLVITNIMVFGF